MADDRERFEARIQAQIDELSARLRRLEEHVYARAEARETRVETAAPRHEPDAGATTRPASQPETPATTATSPGQSSPPVLSLIGRSLLVMAGAFLLRWLTETGKLPQELGSVIGMAYALLWIIMADITAGRGQRHSAVLHAMTGVAIVLPLLVEATTRFRFLSPPVSASCLLAFVAIGLAVAGRRRIRLLAWIVALPAPPLAFFLASKTGVTAPFLSSLLVLGVATLWLAYLRRWQVLATLMAWAANLGIALMVFERLVHPETAATHEISLKGVLFLLFGLIGVYFGSICFRVFHRKRTITPLEISQTIASVVIGVGGAALSVNAEGHSMLPLGVVCFVVAAAGYTASYGFLPRKDPNRRNFIFFTTIALAMFLLGAGLTFSGSMVALLFTAVALCAAGIANRIASPVLYLHGAVYLVAAVVVSGLIATAWRSFAGPHTALEGWLNAPALFTLAVAIAFPWFPRPDGRASDVVLGRRAVDLFVLLSVLAVGGIAVSAIAAWLPDATSDTYRRALANTRTAVLALSACALAWSCRRPGCHRMGWLVYTILFMGAIKFALQDIAAGGAATLFLSFAFYGGALIVAPRLLRRAAGSQPDDDATAGEPAP